MTRTTSSLDFLTLDDGAEKWFRAFRKNPRRTYDLFRVNARGCWQAIVYGYAPGNRMVVQSRRDFPFGRGALEAARTWLAHDGHEPGLERDHPLRLHQPPRVLQ